MPTRAASERFWETIWQEFLSRAQFESFESARERIRLWIKYYNPKQQHIEGLCRADRYFEIATKLRQTILPISASSLNVFYRLAYPCGWRWELTGPLDSFRNSEIVRNGRYYARLVRVYAGNLRRYQKKPKMASRRRSSVAHLGCTL